MILILLCIGYLIHTRKHLIHAAHAPTHTHTHTTGTQIHKQNIIILYTHALNANRHTKHAHTHIHIHTHTHAHIINIHTHTYTHAHDIHVHVYTAWWKECWYSIQWRGSWKMSAHDDPIILHQPRGDLSHYQQNICAERHLWRVCEAIRWNDKVWLYVLDAQLHSGTSLLWTPLGQENVSSALIEIGLISEVPFKRGSTVFLGVNRSLCNLVFVCLFVHLFATGSWQLGIPLIPTTNWAPSLVLNT